MNKLTALETFKLDIVVEETIEKLDFLDTLKSNMGQEMSEMMSEEISRVMTEQRNLEIKYATLSQKRSQLKGLKNKAELQQVIEDIKDTARDLKESTKALCRVLKDNPDIPGNQSKIRDDRIDLKILLARLVDEIKDLSFAKFRSTVREGLESSDKLKKLKDDEKKTQHEIKSITTEHKEKQAECEAEFEELEKDIKQYEKILNDTRTDSELFLKYLQDEADGGVDCQQRLFEQEENTLEDEIKDLVERIEREKMVSEKITKFLNGKKEFLEEQSGKWDQKKDKELERLTNVINEISQKKTEDENKQEEVDAQLQAENADLEQQRRAEEEKQKALERKKEENIARDNAARYLQQKWIWWKTVGKLSSKGKKKGGKKGGKKKK